MFPAPDLTKIPKKKKNFEANESSMREMFQPKSKDAKKERDSPALDRQEKLKAKILSSDFPEEIFQKGGNWVYRCQFWNNVNPIRRVVPRYTINTIGLESERAQEKLRQLGPLGASKANAKTTAKINKKLRRERQVDNTNRLLGLGGDTGEWELIETEKDKDNKKATNKDTIIVQNQFISELACLGKVAASAGFATIPKLKSALEIANLCLKRWRLDINGSKSKAKCKDSEPEWKKPEGIETEIKKGWDLGLELDLALSRHMRHLRADGLGKCFSQCE